MQKRTTAAVVAPRTATALILSLILMSGFAWGAQQTPKVQPGPDTTGLFSARKVFISNLGENINNGTYTPGADEPYNYFYAAMQSWGRYELVLNPGDADLIFEILFDVYIESIPARKGFAYYPQLHVTVRDPKTHLVRKEYTESIQTAFLHSNQEKNFAQAIADLVADMAKTIDLPLSTFTLPQTIPAAPVPPQILAAKKLFISGPVTDPSHGDPEQNEHVYEEVYASARIWGQYELVSAAGNADLVWEPSVYDGVPKLTMRDPHTQVVLWTVDQDVKWEAFTGLTQPVLDRALVGLLNSASSISGKPAFGAPPARGQVVSPDLAVPILVSITTANNNVKSGSPVQIKVTMKNAADFVVAFAYPSGDPLTCVVAVRDANGKTVADTEKGRQLKSQHAAAQGAEAKYTLNPGETQTRECAVSDLYDMTAAGKYSIDVEQLDGRAVVSNLITVTVTP